MVACCLLLAVAVAHGTLFRHLACSVVAALGDTSSPDDEDDRKGDEETDCRFEGVFAAPADPAKPAKQARRTFQLVAIRSDLAASRIHASLASGAKRAASKAGLASRASPLRC